MDFKQLDITDYQNLRIFFDKQQYRLCDYSLLSLIVWSNQRLKTFYSIDDKTLIVYNKSSSNLNDNHLILPISPDANITPEYLFNLAKKLGFISYWSVPEDYLMKYGAKEIESFFKINEQTEFDDYVYLTNDLMYLKGNKFTRQRNLINQFSKAYLEKEKVDVEMINHDNAEECLNFLNEWCDLRKCDMEHNEGLACEKMAAIKTLNNIDALEVKGILVRIDGKVSAFGISSHLTDDMGVLNFEKANPKIKGLYQFLDNECAKRLFADYKYINKESDMKLPNLAQSKKSYNPVMKIKSYRLTLQ
ncbi:MAG TPA: phosphatidylglycerol lysyltransferase domain-containing protein [Syntrophales bacterium]|nr:phosphatidylglycerol lysyltransferase domain-containing protein [Syntrophales bacterium]